ncbi:MAG: hypothetical protein ABW195_14425 [Ilumatobacteraceae bacterium]
MTYTVEAFNTATDSTNKIHDDDVARTYGFHGGLVPGVDVYAYLTHEPAARWGPGWLGHGSIAARFAQPVYDGQLVSVTAAATPDGLDLAVVDPDGTACATATATREPIAPHSASGPPIAALPDPGERPPASPATLAPGTVLGTIDEVFDAAATAGYLADVRETLPLYAAEGLAHPGWLLRFANAVLVRNVVLGPWIHVSSDVALLGALSDGDPLQVRSVVLDEFERKGHRFVTLDVAIDSADRPIQRITHTAIHTPRRRTP